MVQSPLYTLYFLVTGCNTPAQKCRNKEQPHRMGLGLNTSVTPIHTDDLFPTFHGFQCFHLSVEDSNFSSKAFLVRINLN